MGPSDLYRLTSVFNKCYVENVVLTPCNVVITINWKYAILKKFPHIGS